MTIPSGGILIGYARCSTDEQDLTAQRLAGQDPDLDARYMSRCRTLERSETIDETYEWALDGVRRRGFAPDSVEGKADLVARTGYLVLRDVELVRAKRSAAAGAWVQGDIMGPPVKVYETVDYAGWLASDTSAWMGDEMRTELLAGIAEWGTWPGWRDDSMSDDDAAQLYELLDGDLSDGATVQHIRDLLAVRLGTTAQILGLGEAGDTLADRLLAAGLVEMYSRRIGKRAK